jgi:NAD(P)-dependent dehydrogenase (short-subunit alcohol dehydrogenase family)
LTKAVAALAIDGKNRVERHSGLVTCCQEIVVECQDFGAAGAAQWHHSLPGSPAKPSRRTTMGKNINLTGKTAVVTGAGSGIGRATARLLAQHGAKVHVADLNADAAAAVANEIGANATAHQLDVTRPEDLETLAETVFAADGRVDILHNNAGIGHGGDIEETTVEDWQRVIGVNLLGVAYGVQAFVPRMLKQDHPATIINTASEMGLLPARRWRRTAPPSSASSG